MLRHGFDVYLPFYNDYTEINFCLKAVISREDS